MDKEMILTLKIVLILCMAIAEFGVKQSILSVLRIASEWDPMMKCTCIAGTATVLCIVKLYCNFSGVIDYVCIPQNLYVTNDFLLWHSSSFVVNGKQWFDFWCALERFYRPHRSSWDFPVQKNTGTLLYTRPEGVSPIILRAIFRIPITNGYTFRVPSVSRCPFMKGALIFLNELWCSRSQAWIWVTLSGTRISGISWFIMKLLLVEMGRVQPYRVVCLDTSSHPGPLVSSIGTL